EENFIRDNWQKLSFPEFCSHFSITRNIFDRSIIKFNLPVKGKIKKVIPKEQLSKPRKMKRIESKENIPLSDKNNSKVQKTGRILKEFTEEQKTYIIENWSTMSANKIMNNLGISFFIWKKNIDKLSLPEKQKIERNVKQKRIQTKVELSEDQIKT